MLRSLIDAGLCVVRLNFSHGDHEVWCFASLANLDHTHTRTNTSTRKQTNASTHHTHTHTHTAAHTAACSFVVFRWLLQYHAGTIANAREAASEKSKPIAIALDTKGPEIRTGHLEGFDKVQCARACVVCVVCVVMSVSALPFSHLSLPLSMR